MPWPRWWPWRSPSWAGSGSGRAATRRRCGAHRPCWCWDHQRPDGSGDHLRGGGGFGLSLEQPGQLPLWASVLTRGTAGGLLIMAGLVANRRARDVRRPVLVLWLPSILITSSSSSRPVCRSSCPSWWRRPGWRSCDQPHRLADAGHRAAAHRGRGAAGDRLPVLPPLVPGLQAQRARNRCVLAVGLMLAAFSQVLFAVHPGTYSSLVTAGDILQWPSTRPCWPPWRSRCAATSARCVPPTKS